MINTSFEQRTERRNRLIGLLRSEDHWKTAELREQLGVSQRTLMRELAELRRAGYPIDSDRGRGGGIRLNGRWGVDRLNLSHQEVVELVLSLAIMESLQSPLLTSNLKAIKQKLFQAFPQQQRSAVSNIRKRIMIGDNANANVVSLYTKPAQQISENLAESFLQRNYLEIEYQSESGEQTLRVIEAQYTLLNWPIWYVMAWDHLRMSSRVFRIDRIKRARLVDGNFQLRPKHVFTDIYTPFHQTI
ncbi:helix-turn-helix transcriptional regulator [Arenicella xantha]|uniref:Putative DNA-binding transcriptional regulator YafY n=1 Tax=Arenicella xantha TaxID=644221 RepID=A0A395JGC8_9GAMM|nr:WYL domain-containing protein [Arenicella xantha]RBP48791.1 putative DNA-binding transcriptional regulator YafY [Arenicella xantha]